MAEGALDAIDWIFRLVEPAVTPDHGIELEQCEGGGWIVRSTLPA